MTYKVYRFETKGRYDVNGEFRGYYFIEAMETEADALTLINVLANIQADVYRLMAGYRPEVKEYITTTHTGKMIYDEANNITEWFLLERAS